MRDIYDLDRFKRAQFAMYDQALAEMKAGRKRSHWIWYIFPQIAGLGMSELSQKFAIKSLDEAKAYLEDDKLRDHLEDICGALLKLETCDAVQVMGDIDAMKLKSSMTLFDAVSHEQDNIYNKVLAKFFDGEKDEKTLNILNKI